MVRRGTDGTAVLLLQLAACGVLSPLMMAQVSGTSSLNSSAKAELPTFSTAGTAGTAGTGAARWGFAWSAHRVDEQLGWLPTPAAC